MTFGALSAYRKESRMQDNKETYEIMFPKGFTEDQIYSLVAEAIAKIESGGKRIIGTEPIEKIHVEIIGRRFTVEDEGAWEKRRQERTKEDKE